MMEPVTNSIYSPIPFGDRFIGSGYPVFIIAEIGINHEGDPEVCAEMIDKAVHAGANAVKLIIGKADESYVPETESYEIFKRAELMESDIEKLFEYAKSLDVELFSTCGDFVSFEFFSKLFPAAYKISSGLLTHTLLIERVARTGKTILMSTGMADSRIVDDAVETAKNAGAKHIGLFQCTSLYPAPPDTLNLAVISSLEKKYKIPCGFSDHSMDSFAASLAVAAGARMIEKHFTLDPTRTGFDHHISLGPVEFAEMVENIRLAEKMMGSGEKKPSTKEAENAPKTHRCLVAKRDIVQDSTLTDKDIAVMRVNPDMFGLSPSQIKRLIGRKVRRDIKRFSSLKEEDII